MSVESVFPNDITPWGLFNAGRVYCGKIPGQDMGICDVSKGLSLILQSLDKLPISEHGQILIVLLEALVHLVSQERFIENYMRYIISAQIRADDYIQYINDRRSNQKEAVDCEKIEQLKRALKQLL